MSRAACLGGCGWVAPIHSFLAQDRIDRDGEDDDGRGGENGGGHKHKRRRGGEVFLPAGVPRCGGCGVCPAKPDCTLFGEPLPEHAMRAARKACAAADAVIVIGTSLSVGLYKLNPVDR
jgi:hypothetical protein